MKRIAEIPPCPACGQRRFRAIFRKKGRDFWRCTECGAVKQHPLPTLDELREYYDASHEDGLYQAFVEAERIKSLTARGRLRQILPRARSGRWLDVGCSNGAFIAEAVARGVDAAGIDLSRPAVEAARRRGLRASCGTVEDHVPSSPYDTVTAFDVLEHVLDPTAFIQAVRRLLVPRGTVVLTLPDEGSVIRRFMGSRWYFYIPEEHLHYFDPSSLRRFLARNGFRVRHIGRTYKSLTWTYSQLQFEDYNPLVHRVLGAVERFLPASLREAPVPLYIGEMLAVAERTDA